MNYHFTNISATFIENLYLEQVNIFLKIQKEWIYLGEFLYCGVNCIIIETLENNGFLLFDFLNGDFEVSNFIIESVNPNGINLIVFAGNEHASNADLMQRINIEVLAHIGVKLVHQHHRQE